MKIRSILAATAALVLLGGAAHAAGTPALTIDDLNGQQLGNGPFTLGFEFQANANTKVVQLGAFDDAQDGLGQSHDVGLWDSLGNLLASTTIGSGTSGALINQFRYNDITPVSLTAGQDYFIGAVWLDGTDPMVFGATNLATDPRITYLSSGYAAGGSLVDPTSLDGGFGGYFGPNLTLTSVPEPATWAFTILGFGMVGAAVRRRSVGAVAATA